ncbi:MAG: tetratricopeptide repeat protein [Luteolibacter sp.]
MIFVTTLSACGSLCAQAPEDPQFDPSDVYFQAYLDVRAAEQLEKDGDYVGALRKFDSAAKLFESVARFYPEWKAGMVTNRRELTAKAMDTVRTKAGEQIQKDQGVIAELEGGQKMGVDPRDKPNAPVEIKPLPEAKPPEKLGLADRQPSPAPRDEPAPLRPLEITPVKPLPPSVLDVDPLQARRLKEAEAEVARLKDLISKADPRSNEAMRNASRIEDLRKQNETLERKLREAQANGQSESEAQARAEIARLKDQIANADARSNEAMRNATRVGDLTTQNEILERKLRAAEADARSLRLQMAAAPVRGEVEALNGQIAELDRQREAMGKALRSSRGDHTDALAKIEILAADMEIMQQQAKELRQKEANLERDLKTEREVSNSVVAGQRRQIEGLEKALEEKSVELSKANEQIAGLKLELDESQAAYAELREERDGLLVEKEQMTALLKLNEEGRIEQLIEQNMGLAKSLREANEKVDRLNLDNNAAKDDVVAALRDLAMAKSQINRLKQEKDAQDKRLQELTARLENEESALANGAVEADPEEVEMLREVIKRQLLVQERRRQARELLVEAAQDLGRDDDRLNEAIEMFSGAEIVLSPEEQKLIADQQVDGEFVSPFARDRATVRSATSDLNRELESYDKAATKAFLAGRLLPTRELYEMMVEEHPGHVPALCKLGVVQMKLNEPMAAAESFQKAIELDEGNAYAYRMLGYATMSMGDIGAAQRLVKKSVDLAPDDAKSSVLLGMISIKLGELDEAELNFKAAISADPLPSEPYFNLAMLCAKSGRLEESRQYYHDALERGAVPDAGLEQKYSKLQ